MPCSDVTEILELHVDHDERLLDYALTKRTCGAEVGASALLLERLRGLSGDELLALDGMGIAGGSPGELDGFLAAKHLVALRRGLRVLRGLDAGRPGDPCVLESLSAEPTGLRLRLLVAVDVLTSEIEACGNCGGCGSRSRTVRRDP